MDKKKKDDNREFDGNCVDIITIHNNLMHLIKEKCNEDNHSMNYYLIHSIPLLDRYKECLNRQVKIKFVGVMIPSNIEEEIHTIIRDYLKLVRHYFPEEYAKNNMEDMDKYIINPQHSSSVQVFRFGKKQKCASCLTDNMKIANHDNFFVCEQCGYVYDSVTNDISFKDIDRVNISNKYMYDRRTHFRDTINQYQGKQNATIDQSVYTDLIEQFKNHHLIPDNYQDLPKEVAFKDIYKEHVILFLKETGHSKHYEDVTLIHHQLTGKPTPDIAHLENQLLQDFDQLTDLYDKQFRNNNERKNFINTQYVLFQLLKRHKYPCRKEEFSILKTIDRKYFHDNIMQSLFETLGWNIHPLF
jgi:ribosomal protein S27AE